MCAFICSIVALSNVANPVALNRCATRRAFLASVRIMHCTTIEVFVCMRDVGPLNGAVRAMTISAAPTSSADASARRNLSCLTILKDATDSPTADTTMSTNTFVVGVGVGAGVCSGVGARVRNGVGMGVGEL